MARPSALRSTIPCQLPSKPGNPPKFPRIQALVHHFISTNGDLVALDARFVYIMRISMVTLWSKPTKHFPVFSFPSPLPLTRLMQERGDPIRSDLAPPQIVRSCEFSDLWVSTPLVHCDSNSLDLDMGGFSDQGVM
jgi:hypothetical protein